MITPFKLLLIVLVVLIVFGAGKLPKVMGDLGKGVRNFKDGLNAKDEAAKEAEPKQSVLDHKAEIPPTKPVSAETEDVKKS